jgi:hypothetical protein
MEHWFVVRIRAVCRYLCCIPRITVLSPSPLVSSPETGTWKELINGGAFGLEAGLGATAILVLSCVIVLLLPTKKSEIPKEYVA